MIADDLIYYSNFLVKYDDSEYYDYLNKNITIINLPKNLNQISEGILRCAIEKIFYILLRHRHWVHCQILKDASLDFLISQLNIPRDSCEQLLDVSFSYAQEFFQDYSQICCDDKDFLRYIFIECTLHKSEHDLIRSLGIGRSLIDKIRQAIDIASAIQLAEATAPLQFLPKLDFLVAELLLEFEAECSSSSKKIVFYRLKYHLIREKIFLVFYSDEVFVDALANILIDLGSKGSFSQRFFNRKAKKMVTDYGKLTKRNLLEDLIKAGIFYYATGQSGHSSKLELTVFSKKVVASSVIYSLFDKKDADILSLSNIDDVFQFEYVNSLVNNIAFLEDFLLKVRPVGPRTFHHAIKVFKSMASPDRFLQIINFLIAQEKSVLLQSVLRCYSEKSPNTSGIIDQGGVAVAKSCRSSINSTI